MVVMAGKEENDGVNNERVDDVTSGFVGAEAYEALAPTSRAHC